MIPPAAMQTEARRYRERLIKIRALFKNRNDVPSPRIHRIKVLASGAATRMQGYAARLGLGITRTRNHTSDPRPRNGRRNFAYHAALRFIALPFLL
jgi:hypothetical protein